MRRKVGDLHARPPDWDIDDSKIDPSQHNTENYFTYHRYTATRVILVVRNTSESVTGQM